MSDGKNYESLLRLSCEAVARMFNLKNGIQVVAAFQDSEDIASNSISFRIRGYGHKYAEGSRRSYLPSLEDIQRRVEPKVILLPHGVTLEQVERLLEEATRQPPSLDRMGVTSVHI